MSGLAFAKATYGLPFAKATYGLPFAKATYSLPFAKAKGKDHYGHSIVVVLLLLRKSKRPLRILKKDSKLSFYSYPCGLGDRT